ncbi:hypothetical protein [Glaciibacter sp. 2TAF33]|uniref:hypothetical protein n=1 Tax=Glaciibacter sp. 2TAF33 TaxID=3233015 RepID=UPI003F8FF457
MTETDGSDNRTGGGGAVVRFRCGHGAAPEEARVTLQRSCPLCMLLAETKRSRGQLLRKAAPAKRGALAAETRIGAEYEWICERGHSRYAASVMDVLTGPGCPKCWANAQAPSARHEGGVAFMKPGLKTRTSATEQRLRALLGERITLPHRVNAIRISRTFYGKPEVWPDIIIAALRIAVEYDDPGRDRTAHRGMKEVSDLEKDAALAEVGWDVIRVRGGGLAELGPHSIVCTAITPAIVDGIMGMLRELRGDDAVDRIRVAPTTLEARSETTSFEGRSETTTFEGRSETTSFEGRSETTSFEGRSETTSFEGRSDTTSFEGRSDTTSFEGRSDTTSLEGRSDTTSFEGRSETTSFEGRSETTTGRSPDDDATFEP